MRDTGSSAYASARARASRSSWRTHRHDDEGRIVALVCRRRVIAAALLTAALFVVLGCSRSTPPGIATSAGRSTTTTAPATGPARATMLDQNGAANIPAGAQPRLAADPAQVADDLVGDDQALHDPSAPEAVLAQAARRQQAAYRAIGNHPEWDALTRARVPSSMLEVYDRNVDARRQLVALAHAKDTLPAWRIEAPAPADELLNTTGKRSQRPESAGTTWPPSTSSRAASAASMG